MKKTELEKQISKTIGTNMKDYRKKAKLTRDRFLEEMDNCEAWCDGDQDCFSISFETFKSYETGVRESPVSKFFIIAILLNMDLNKLKDEIQDKYGIKPLEIKPLEKE